MVAFCFAFLRALTSEIAMLAASAAVYVTKPSAEAIGASFSPGASRHKSPILIEQVVVSRQYLILFEYCNCLKSTYESSKV